MEALAAVKLDAEAGHEAPDLSKRTRRPIVTGTSVLAVKYRDGILMSADTLASYGSLARFKDVSRLRAVGKGVILGASGDYSDFQHIMDTLDEMTLKDKCLDDKRELTAKEVHAYMTRMLYQRRNKMDPLWNSLLIAGFKDGKPVLGTVDKIGTTYEDDFLATGFGMHLAIPIMRSRWRADMNEGEARALLEDCMRVLFYRDCRSVNSIQLAKITADGPLISDPYPLSTRWTFESFVNPHAGSDTGGSW